MMSLRSLPVGAEIYIDGQFIENSDFVLRDFIIGNHVVMARHAGKELSRDVKLIEKDELSFLFDFKGMKVRVTSKKEELNRKYRSNHDIRLYSHFRFNNYRRSGRSTDTVSSVFYMPNGSKSALRIVVNYHNTYKELKQKTKHVYIVHDVYVNFKMYLGKKLVAKGGYNPSIYRKVVTNPSRYNPINIKFTDQQGLMDGTYSSKGGYFNYRVFWSKPRGRYELITRFEITKKFRINP